MSSDEYAAFVRRADNAATVAELRTIADEARASHPADADADLIDATCFTYATALIERTPDRSSFVPSYVEPEVRRTARAVVGVRNAPGSNVHETPARLLTFDRRPQ